MSRLGDQERETVDEVWGKFAEGERSGEFFLEIEYVLEVYMKRHYPRGSDFLEAVTEAAGGGFERVLVLGSGNGALERAIAQRGLAQDILGIDVSERALAHSRRAAEEAGFEGIRYLAADLNRPPNGLGTFDLVFAPSSVHHVEELETYFDWVAASLRPGGLFAMQEYVGPSRNQWTPKQLEVANGVLPLIPEYFRRLPDGTHKEDIWTPTPEEMIASDPSEAVRSAEILPLLEERFEVVRRVDNGGALAMLVLHGISRNFHHDESDSLAVLRFLLHVDDLLMREQVLESNFCDVIARPRSSPRRHPPDSKGF